MVYQTERDSLSPGLSVTLMYCLSWHDVIMALSQRTFHLIVHDKKASQHHILFFLHHNVPLFDAVTCDDPILGIRIFVNK